MPRGRSGSNRSPARKITSWFLGPPYERTGGPISSYRVVKCLCVSQGLIAKKLIATPPFGFNLPFMFRMLFVVKTKLSIRKEESEEKAAWLSSVANTTRSYFLSVFCRKERASSICKFTCFDK